MKLKRFGTDGIRGEFGGAAINEKIAFHAGRAAVQLANHHLSRSAPKIVIGRDTRESGVKLFAALASGISREGGKPIDLGVAPTPGIAKMALRSRAALACSLTASHNPCQDNGLKFFLGNGAKLSEALEKDLDDRLDALVNEGSPEEYGGEAWESSTIEPYEAQLLSSFPEKLLNGFRIALDCANGAFSGLAPRVFEILGAEVTAIGVSPNGRNINSGVGSECPEALRSLYLDGHYDFGFAFDGDGDRMIAFDENGEKLSGEATLMILAIAAKESGELARDTLVTTIQSNLGLDAAMEKRGIEVKRVDVGDKHIARLMLSESYSLGGEESGHIIFAEDALTGDGLSAALKFADAVIQSGKPIGELAEAYRPFPQVSLSVEVGAKPPLESCASLKHEMEEIESALGEQGRLLVRYSGTEPKLRLLVEAKDQEIAESAAKRLVAAAEKDLQLI